MLYVRSFLTTIFAITLFWSHASNPIIAAPRAGIRIVAVSGETAAGSGGVFEGFSAPVINEFGEVAFGADVAGIPGVTGQVEALYVEDGPDLMFRTRVGLSLPGGGGEIQNLSQYQISSSGEFLVRGSYSGSGTPRMVLSDTGGAFRTVAAEGFLVSGLGEGVRFGHNFRQPALSTTGIAAFGVDLTKDVLPEGSVEHFGRSIWRETHGVLEPIVVEGAPAPMTDETTYFGDLGTSNIVVNDRGYVAFAATLSGPNVTNDDFSTIYVGDGTALRLVSRRGDPAPGMEPGDTLAILGNRMSINGQGDIAFGTTVFTATGPDVAGIFIERDGQLDKVVTTGDYLPGLPPDVFISTMGETPLLNDRGEIAFGGVVDGPGVSSYNHSGFWSEGLGGLHLVRRKGNQAAELEAGVVFGASYSRSFMNEAGQTMFHAGLDGPGIVDANDRGIWAEDLTGELRLIIREGDMIEVATDEFRIVKSLTLPNVSTGSGNADGRRSPFSDLGHVAFLAEFTDGTSGVFVSSAVAVPEPLSAVMLATGFITICGLTRRRNFA